MPDALFRQRLRTHYRDLQVQLREAERGSKLWFAIERAIWATDRVHIEAYGECIAPVHYAGGGSNLPPGPPPPPSPDQGENRSATEEPGDPA